MVDNLLFFRLGIQKGTTRNQVRPIACKLREINHQISLGRGKGEA